MFFPIYAMIAGSIGLAAAQPVPTFNVDPSCDAVARTAAPENSPADSNSMSACRDAEQKARAQVVKQWSEISAADKAECVPLSTVGGAPTYTELVTCIELTREARRLRSQEQPSKTPEPATTGQNAE
jgi:hypothetical protein